MEILTKENALLVNSAKPFRTSSTKTVTT